MPHEDHQNEKPLGGAWAQQQKEGLKNQEQSAKENQQLGQSLNNLQQGGQRVTEGQQQGAQGEVQRETGQMLKGPKPGMLPENVLDGPKQRAEEGAGHKQMGGKSLNEGAKQQQHQGEDRTPDQIIGQVAHADGQKRQQGGAGEPEATPLEPEKQGGIGGP
jgi:hypothetical protein